ncbi:MAG TPA: hypothetical protein VOA80_00645, partial [Thermoanaerobaculia bacterium]|nr:hypothetical protein [Thermoanaerobaculia bacterium]
LQPTTSLRPSLRSDEWSPSSEQVVAFAGIRILAQQGDHPVKVIGLGQLDRARRRQARTIAPRP